jgi:hypothetical protein
MNVSPDLVWKLHETISMCDTGDIQHAWDYAAVLLRPLNDPDRQAVKSVRETIKHVFGQEWLLNPLGEVSAMTSRRPKPPKTSKPPKRGRQSNLKTQDS